jgi:RHS repeat-associated protein
VTEPQTRTKYTYDANGNTLTKVVSSNTTSYTWDFENRLTSVALPGSGGTISFAYDPFGRRIKKVTPTATSVFAYDGGNLIEEANSSGTAVARYSQGLSIDEPLAMLRSSITSFYNADGLGSITSLGNAAGSLAQTYTFDSFGNQTASSGSLTNPFQYTAREADSETGLHYYRARYYDSIAGRFLSEDPIGFLGGAQFYRYTLNAPTKHRDPTGLKPGDRYDSAKVAALQALIDVLAKTNAEGVEYAGVIYQNWDGTYSYTAPHRGTPTGSDSGSCPFFTNKIGTYHTHPDVPGYASYEPSLEDLIGDFIHMEYGWIALPDGTVLQDPPIGDAVKIGKIPGGVGHP